MCEKNGFNTHFYELDARLGLGIFQNIIMTRCRLCFYFSDFEFYGDFLAMKVFEIPISLSKHNLILMKYLENETFLASFKQCEVLLNRLCGVQPVNQKIFLNQGYDITNH